MPTTPGAAMTRESGRFLRELGSIVRNPKNAIQVSPPVADRRAHGTTRLRWSASADCSCARDCWVRCFLLWPDSSGVDSRSWSVRRVTPLVVVGKSAPGPKCLRRGCAGILSVRAGRARSLLPLCAGRSRHAAPEDSMALSQQRPTAPIEPRSVASRSRSPDAHDVHCVPCWDGAWPALGGSAPNGGSGRGGDAGAGTDVVLDAAADDADRKAGPSPLRRTDSPLCRGLGDGGPPPPAPSGSHLTGARPSSAAASIVASSRGTCAGRAVHGARISRSIRCAEPAGSTQDPLGCPVGTRSPRNAMDSTV